MRPLGTAGTPPASGSNVFLLACAATVCAGILGCRSSKGLPSPEALASLAKGGDEKPLDHGGPSVELGAEGPARFVSTLFNAFREEAAMDTVEFMDARYRTPGSKGFEEALDRIEAELRLVGFGSREDLELEILESPMEVPSWTARSGELRLFTSSGGESVLHAFDRPSSLDRCLLPANAPSADVRGPVCLTLADLKPGDILVTETTLRRDTMLRAKNQGAVALVSASINSYNTDPSGRERHLDAIQFRSLDPSVGLPVAQISKRSLRAIEAAAEAGGAQLGLKAEVEFGESSTRTIVATIVGEDRPDEVVALSSHLEAPGASDNASGAAGQLENALALARVLTAGGFNRPSRSLAFIWGPENQEATDWLEHQGRRPVAAVNAVMIGESVEKTGARPLLERYPDPGGLHTLAPDEHTVWGSRDIDPSWLVPNGLSIIARCAMVDVSENVGGWKTFENPYEGGTDHERFITSGVPAVLFWHFTDFSFHTSLDRVNLVDGAELKRMAVTALVTAMAIADPRPQDLTRYLECVNRERVMRVRVAEEAQELALAEDWRTWSSGVRNWFRIECLGLQGKGNELPGVMESAYIKERDQ